RGRLRPPPSPQAPGLITVPIVKIVITAQIVTDGIDPILKFGKDRIILIMPLTVTRVITGTIVITLLGGTTRTHDIGGKIAPDGIIPLPVAIVPILIIAHPADCAGCEPAGATDGIKHTTLTTVPM
ncbi:MAG: hypothetical protein ACYTFQ_31620, partial [Planctomycetota bacterium]